MVWQFGESAKQKITVLILSLTILLGIFLANFVLQKAYGTDLILTGSNFSYTLCGLTIGTTWEGCPAKLKEEGKDLSPGDEAAASKLLYSLAWDNLKKDPTILFQRLGGASHNFVTQLPDLFWRGYFSLIVEPTWLPQTFLSMLSVFGVLYVMIRWREQGEIAFWLLLWAGIVASASFVFFDDGRRVLAAAIPFYSCFLRWGLRDPA